MDCHGRIIKHFSSTLTTTFVSAGDKGEQDIRTTVLISHPSTDILPELNGCQNMTLHALEV